MTTTHNHRHDEKPAPEWFRRAIIDGLKGLVALRLPGTPSADTVAMTRDVWVRVLCKNKEWDQDLDAKRIDDAFIKLCLDSDKWPGPKDFLEALQKRELPTALPAPAYDREKHRKSMDKIKALVDTCYTPAKPKSQATRS